MEVLTKNQIVSKVRCTFYVWTPNIDALRVTKKELRLSLKPSKPYSVDAVASGTISYGKHKGEDWMTYVIMI